MQIAVVQGPEANHITQPLVPIVEVAFRYGQWWALSKQMSEGILQNFRAGQNAVYTYDWGENGRDGSWKPDGETTKINRYMLDYTCMLQTNLDNQRQRSFRIVYVRPQDVEPRFTGQIPEAS